MATTDTAVRKATPTQAKALDKKIRTLVGKISDSHATLSQLVADAQASKVHETLGFATWQSYVTDVASGLPMLKDKAQRQSRIHFLLGAGLSLRACAEIAGVSKSTVQNVATTAGDAKSGDATGDAKSGKGGKGAAQVHRKISEKGAITAVDRVTENVDDLENIEDVAVLLDALQRATKAVAVRHDFLVAERAKGGPKSSKEGNDSRTGQVAA